MSNSKNPKSKQNDKIATAATSQNIWLRNYWPLLLSGLFSLIWIGICLWWFILSDKTLARMPLYEAGGLLAGASLPLILLWLMALVYLRITALQNEKMGQSPILARGMDNLLNPLDNVQERISRIIGGLHKEIKNMEVAGDIATSRIEHLEKRFQSQISDLYEATTDAEAKAVNIQTVLSSERETFSGQADKITRQIDQLQTQFSKINDDSETMISSVNKSSNKLNKKISEQNDLVDKLNISLQNLKEQSNTINEDTREITGNIRVEIEKFSNNMDNMHRQSENTVQNIQEIWEKVGSLFAATDNKAAALSQNWLTMATLVNVQAKDSISRINNLGEKLTELEKENVQAAGLAGNNFAKVTDQMQHASESIYLASSSAIEAADETNSAIDKNARKFQQLINAIQLSNKSILSDANAIEKKNREKGGSHFSALASRIIEQLQSLSIDINRYFEEDVSDKIWQSYVEGDKNTFVRRLKKITYRKDTETLRKKYKTDPEFRKYSLEFIQIFEDMMSQSMASDTYSIFSVALISSEIGKIYLALAQAGDRISTK